uniref:NACHT domain-containing protein n=1 Tax=Xiphophorus couchianus TaxID=32473 RepID=A0A3B5KQZ0_9TELE
MTVNTKEIGNPEMSPLRVTHQGQMLFKCDALKPSTLKLSFFLYLLESFITCQQTLKSNLKKKLQFVFEGIAKSGNQTFLNQIYTELYITEGDSGDVNKEHEVRQIESVSWKPDRPETTIRHEDIFKHSPDRDEPIRAVMTKGVAGIGKTVLAQKFTLDWAEDQANQDIQFTFPFTFRELNLLKDQQFSLVELVHHFFSETRGISTFEELKVVFIFDGLDESRLPLDFNNNEILTDVRKSTSVDVLLTNLIRGNLLPKAHLWITTRPAAASRIPPEFIGMMTEIRGFTDSQKDEYFTKKFRYKKQARMVISHVKESRTLHIMCHIPIFCWITAKVVEDMLNKKDGEELPKTLTEMYIHFLVVQTKLKVIKYDGGAETDSHWSPKSRKMIESLGKLAFDQLMKRNLIFYESDLAECGIDARAASTYSGVFTQIFREERGLYQNKVFCFVHLSVQEFLAALHELEKRSHEFPETNIYKNGHLDLFLRFLLGLSLETNRRHLRGFVAQTEESLYRAFIKAFKQGVEIKTTNADCLHYQEQFTKGQPRELVRSCQHMDPDYGYTVAKTLLQEHFRNPYKAATAYINKALSWPTIRTEDIRALQSYSLFLCGCCNVMEQLEYVQELDMPINMRAILAKLPYKLREC